MNIKEKFDFDGQSDFDDRIEVEDEHLSFEVEDHISPKEEEENFYRSLEEY